MIVESEEVGEWAPEKAGFVSVATLPLNDDVLYATPQEAQMILNYHQANYEDLVVRVIGLRQDCQIMQQSVKEQGFANEQDNQNLKHLQMELSRAIILRDVIGRMLNNNKMVYKQTFGKEWTECITQ